MVENAFPILVIINDGKPGQEDCWFTGLLMIVIGYYYTSIFGNLVIYHNPQQTDLLWPILHPGKSSMANPRPIKIPSKPGTIWLFVTSPWKDPQFLSTVDHLFRLGPSKNHGYVNHNQRVNPIISPINPHKSPLNHH